MSFKELDVDDWFVELDRGLAYRKKYGLEDVWASLEAMFYNVHPSNEVGGPNLIVSNGDSILSALSVPQPYISVKPRRRGLEENARIVERVDNNLITDLEIPFEMEQAITHAFLWGRGILKVGYDSEYGYVPKFDFGSPIGEEFGLTLTQFDKKGKRLEFSNVRPGMPWVNACLPHDIIVPWGTGAKIERAPWIAHRVVRHVDEIKGDPKYSNKSDIQAVLSMEDFTKSYTTVQKNYRAGGAAGQAWSAKASRSAEFCELFEIHDMRTGKVKVIATGHRKFLRNDTDILLEAGLPFVSINFTPAARCFWTTPDAFYLQQPQAELADITLQAMKQRRAAVLLFLYQEGAIEEEDIEKILSGQVAAGVKVKQHVNMRDAVAMVNPMSGNNQIYLDAEQVRSNSRETVGFSKNAMGELAVGRKTAEEVATVRQAGNQRLSRRYTVVRRGYEAVIRKLNWITSSFWKSPRWVELGDGQWVKYDGSTLKGEYGYDINFTSEPMHTLAGRRQEALQLYSMLRQDPTINPQKLLKYMSLAYNDPELETIFADIRTQMSEMSGDQGGGQGGQGPQPAGRMSRMRP